MSTSASKSKAKPAAKLPGWQQRKLSPVRGLVGLGLLGLILVNFDTCWNTFAEMVLIVLEVAEESMDILLEYVGLGSAAAQMVTAYTGLGLGLLLLTIVVRRLPAWARQFRWLLRDYREMYLYMARIGLRTGRLEVAAWWASLDGFGKFIAAVAGLVVALPALLLLSYGLGLLVSLLF